MKKLLILLFAVGTVSVTSAQSSGYHDGRFDRDRDVVMSDHNNERSHNAGRQKEAMIRSVNADFDRRVGEINSNYRLKNRQKAKLIRQLNKERAEQIREINDRFSKVDRDRDSRYGDYKGHRS